MERYDTKRFTGNNCFLRTCQAENPPNCQENRQLVRDRLSTFTPARILHYVPARRALVHELSTREGAPERPFVKPNWRLDFDPCRPETSRPGLPAASRGRPRASHHEPPGNHETL